MVEGRGIGLLEGISDGSDIFDTYYPTIDRLDDGILQLLDTLVLARHTHGEVVGTLRDKARGDVDIVCLEHHRQLRHRHTIGLHPRGVYLDTYLTLRLS